MNKDEIHEIWVPESDRLLVAFSGFGAHFRAREPFNFMGITKKYDVNKIFMRDLRKTWYHFEVDGLTKNVDETAEYISTNIEVRGIDKLAVIGVSAGGYAALVFGWLLEAGEVHAIAGQTFVDAGNRLEYDILTDEDDVPKLYDYPEACRQYFDVKTLLEDSPNGKTAYHLHYSVDFEHDKVHAERLSGLPGVHLHQYELGSGHKLAYYLTKDGTVDRLLQSALDVQPSVVET